MKSFPLILALAAFCAFTAPAQAQILTVHLSLPQDQFLPGETLPVTVQVTNLSGQSLHLGADPKWLTFNVESADNDFVVMKNADPPVTDPFTLGSADVATKRLDLAPYFVVTHPGRYRLSASVHIPEWGKDVASPAIQFDVIDGVPLWSQDFGMPLPAGVTNQQPVIRKYILEEANYLRNQLRLYVLVTDQPRAQVFKVSAIGPMVSFNQPEAQLDPSSNLHVIYQCGAHIFLYSVINPDGVITKQDVYDYLGTRPRLGVDSAGNIVEQGGVRRPRPGELPVVRAPDEVPAPAKPVK